MTKRLLIAIGVLLVIIPVALAQDDAPAAEIMNDEGGAQVITGELNYTSGNFNRLYYDPYVILYDSAWAVDRDFEFVPSLSSQQLGRFTSSVFESPIGLELALPDLPQGEFRDVDNDDSEDAGVQVYSLAIFSNLWGDAFMDERDDWASSYPSVVVSNDGATLGELEGGKLIVWAPNDQQGFPSGFGEDGFVFTEDDPIVTIPQGWTIVDMDTDPFTFDRSAFPTVDMLEPEGAEQDDFSDLSYTEAFDAMIDLLEEEYAFTELKNIDWDEKRATFRPRIEDAEANEDPAAYRLALRDFAWSIPDGHMFGPTDNNAFFQATAGGLGIAIRELDDGRVIVNFVTEGSPAAEEGIELAAEIFEINGQPILEAVEEVQPWSLPFSTDHVLRLQQLRYVTRFELGAEVELVYLNPGDSEPTTVTLTTSDERESFAFSSFNRGRTGTEYPVEFEILDSGYGYVKIYSFIDDMPLTVELWDRAMGTFIAAGVPGIIVDMRQNGGGFSTVGFQMASYFFDEDHIIEINGFYDDSISGTFIFEESPERYTPPAEELQYDGDVVVLVSPNCSSACEYVSRAMSLRGRAEVVGFYPTAGMGGGWQPFLMPEGVTMPLIVSTSYDEDLELIIESRPVEPTIVVPKTEETLLTDEDVELNTAIETLDGMLSFEMEEITSVEIGDSIPGIFEAGVRDQYEFEVAEGDSFVIELRSPEGIDPFLRLYIQDDPVPVAISDDIPFEDTRSARIEVEDVPADFTFIIEAATVRDADEGAYILNILEPEVEEVEVAATEEAMMTEEAMATEEMSTTEEPIMTEEAMATEEMAATEEAVMTEEPMATEEMAATEEAMMTEEAMATEEMAATEEAVMTEEPMATEEMAATEEAMMTEEAMATEEAP